MNHLCVLRPRPFPVPLVLCFLLLGSGMPMQAAPDPATCPLHAEHMATKDAAADAAAPPANHDARHDAVDQRGDATMGFDHRKSRHVFTLTEGGGVIRVQVLAAGDAPSLAAIRTHLAVLPEAFARGDFSMPTEIHGVLPPGAADMARLRGVIRYQYVENPDGGEVRLASDDSAARLAIHQFLRFQIEDHRTGDPTTVQEK
jgi:hypothetical protein